MAKETKAAGATCFHPSHLPNKSADCPPYLYLDRSRIPSTGNHAKSNVFAAASNLAWDHQVVWQPLIIHDDPCVSVLICAGWILHYISRTVAFYRQFGFPVICSILMTFANRERNNTLWSVYEYVYFTYLEYCPSFTVYFVGNYACC